MKNYYYLENGVVSESLSKESILIMSETGEINFNTMVWTRGMDGWKFFDKTDSLFSLEKDSGECLPPPVPKLHPIGNQRRPFLRLAARSIDIMIFFILFMTSMILLESVIGSVENIIDAVPNLIFSVGLALTYSMWESALISFFGNTPGKGILKISVRRIDGTKPAFSEVFKRSFKVYFNGMGLGIAIIHLFCMHKEKNNLKRFGILSWDREAGLRTIHRNVGFLRRFIGATSILLITGLYTTIIVVYVAEILKQI